MKGDMRPVWVKAWDKLEIRQRAEEQGCFMADVVTFMLDQEVAGPAGTVRRYHTDPEARTRLQVYKPDMVRLKALKKEWGVYLHQVIGHLLREVRGGREARPDAEVEMVRRAEGYRREIAEYEAGLASCSEGL